MKSKFAIYAYQIKLHRKKLITKVREREYMHALYKQHLIKKGTGNMEVFLIKFN